MKTLCDEVYPQADVTRVVLDNLNTHAYGSLFAAFPPDEAWRLRRKLEFHSTSEHASWRNMAECKWSVRAGQCLNRRIESREGLAAEGAAGAGHPEQGGAKIERTFRVGDARKKLDDLYTKELVR